MNKKIILAIIILIILVLIIYQVFLKKEEATFELVEVVKGTISQEVSEAGQVKKGEEINLSFENAGRIENIYVAVGQDVERGKLLARIDTIDLSIQLKEAQASLAIYQAQLDKLLAGASQEEIQVAQTKVDNAQISLDTEKQDLEDAYEDALNTLDDAYLKAYNSQITADLIQRTYFTKNDQEGLRVKENKEKIESAVAEIKSELNTAKVSPTHENIDSALSQTEDGLSDIADALKTIRETCEDPVYRDTVSSANKSSLDTHRTNINTALTNITDDQQSITSAQFSVDSVAGVLKSAQDELSLLIAPPRQEDVDLYQAQVDQVQAQVDILENKIGKANLRAPVKGQITDIKKTVGEMVQPALQDIVITLLPDDPYEIEVDIYEEDVVKINIDNPVDIELVAFPEEIFKGRIIAIDPTEKLVEGVVYYEVTITFEEIPDGLKAGMTADLIIKTATKENVLVIPEEAIFKKDGKTIVKLFKDDERKEIEEREIAIGLQGSDDLFEVISGLEEGEKVILE